MRESHEPLLNLKELGCYRNCWTKANAIKRTVDDNILNSAAKFYYDQYTREFYAKHPEYGRNKKYLKPELFHFPQF